jgi:hypothetical protein
MLHRLLATAAWTAFALIVFSTISPLSMRPVATADPNIERFAAFALLGFLFGLAYPRRLAVDASFVVITTGTATWRTRSSKRQAGLLAWRRRL